MGPDPLYRYVRTPPCFSKSPVCFSALSWSGKLYQEQEKGCLRSTQYIAAFSLLKGDSRALFWATNSITDPYHSIVVPSTHFYLAIGPSNSKHHPHGSVHPAHQPPAQCRAVSRPEQANYLRLSGDPRGSAVLVVVWFKRSNVVHPFPSPAIAFAYSRQFDLDST